MEVSGSDGGAARRGRLDALLSHFPPTAVAFAYGSSVFPQRDGPHDKRGTAAAALSERTIGLVTHPSEEGQRGSDSSTSPLHWASASSPSLSSVAAEGDESVWVSKSGGNGTVDLIFGVDDLSEWLGANIALNPMHYPFGARVTGPRLLSLMARRLGSGVKYHVGPTVCVQGVLVKYGVVEVDTMKDDLERWSTLHLSGRMQKPIAWLKWNVDIHAAQLVNLKRSLGLARVLLPEHFSEHDLWHKIAERSYWGDVRTYFKAEDPRKVLRIVHGTGRKRFRNLYAPVLHGMMGDGLWVQHEGGGATPFNSSVRGSHSGERARISCSGGGLTLYQDKSHTAIVKILSVLPSWMLMRSAQALGSQSVPSASYFESLTHSVRQEAKLELAGMLLRKYGTASVSATLVHSLGAVNLRSSLRQAAFGLYTAGPAIAFSYGLRKLQKGGWSSVA